MGSKDFFRYDWPKNPKNLSPWLVKSSQTNFNARSDCHSVYSCLITTVPSRLIWAEIKFTMHVSLSKCLINLCKTHKTTGAMSILVLVYILYLQSMECSPKYISSMLKLWRWVPWADSFTLILNLRTLLSFFKSPKDFSIFIGFLFFEPWVLRSGKCSSNPPEATIGTLKSSLSKSFVSYLPGSKLFCEGM